MDPGYLARPEEVLVRLCVEPDWFSIFKARYDAATAGLREARGARRVVTEAPLPRPLAAYAGEYQHPGYGTITITITITAERGTLKPRLGTMDLSLTHRHYETFDLEWHELGGPVPPLPAHVPFGPGRRHHRPHGPLRAIGRAAAVRPATGRRGAGPGGSSPSVRHLHHGPNRGSGRPEGRPVADRRNARRPALRAAGRTGLRFEVKGQPGITAEFELDETGTVVRLVAQPLGIFRPKT
jgi:hypothetical protein